MRQTIIKILLLTPFLFFSPNYGDNNGIENLENEPMELQIRKLNLEHCNQKIMSVESEITYRLFLKNFNDEQNKG